MSERYEKKTPPKPTITHGEWQKNWQIHNFCSHLIIIPFAAGFRASFSLKSGQIQKVVVDPRKNTQTKHHGDDSWQGRTGKNLLRWVMKRERWYKENERKEISTIFLPLEILAVMFALHKIHVIHKMRIKCVLERWRQNEKGRGGKTQTNHRISQFKM